MASIAVLHAYFTILGGGEYLCFNLVDALDVKHRVVVYTVTPVDVKKVRSLFGIDPARYWIIVKDEYEAKLMGIMKGRLVRLRRIISYHRFFTRMAEELEDFDLVIDTQSNIPSPVDLAYIHYPAVVETFSGKPSNVYDWLVKYLYKRWFGKALSARIATNSKWTARVIYKYYHVLPDVIYPPVNIDEFKKVYNNNDKRENIVVTVSRFTPEKNLDKLVYVAKAMRDYTFVLVGSTSPYSKETIDRVVELKKKLGVNNLVLKPDLPRDELLKLVGVAKYYLHPPFNEHFGIAVVEAMAAGLVPIVFRDGGTWYDIVSRVDTRLGYKRVDEIPKIIDSIEKDYYRLSEKSHKVSLTFDKGVFRERILDYVDKLLEVKIW